MHIERRKRREMGKKGVTRMLLGSHFNISREGSNFLQDFTPSLSTHVPVLFLFSRSPHFTLPLAARQENIILLTLMEIISDTLPPFELV